ncbi:MAG: hypothetical protein ALECFALPRED_001437 [Alectoria fallacina]|uniref:Uncharacterized protein n=1 Tax=Alectoria fallacina TaxID=1903189 RepID=A0A8H3PKT6_9LECA|nr:MAG: hypothetical protein ALECFALPRED_001437 [Alectoria fallacina]
MARCKIDPKPSSLSLPLTALSAADTKYYRRKRLRGSQQLRVQRTPHRRTHDQSALEKLGDGRREQGVVNQSAGVALSRGEDAIAVDGSHDGILADEHGLRERSHALKAVESVGVALAGRASIPAAVGGVDVEAGAFLVDGVG